MEERKAKLSRSTRETEIILELNLDGGGNAAVTTGIGFLDHMLTLFAYHGKMDLSLQAKGDLHVDDHHTAEDIGIALGKAVRDAAGEKKGIERYGFEILPMDEALVQVAADFSGRPYLTYNVQFLREKIGDLSSEAVEEFLRAFAVNGGITLHIQLLAGRNAHHICEAVFKALGRVCRKALKITGEEIPSSKGVLE
jgi:imidazoleglycerol-phosphate dehydratase